MLHTFLRCTVLLVFFFPCNTLLSSPSHIQLLNECPPNPPFVCLFAHGVGLSPLTYEKQAKPYLDNTIISIPCYSFNFNDSIGAINLGQEHDCALFLKAYKELTALHPTARILLAGISRGAVTILNCIALNAEVDWSPVQAALLESPYSHVTNIAEQIARSYMFFIPFNKKLMCKLMNWLPSYNVNGIQPITSVEKLKIKFPLFIAYSQIDKTVPATSTLQLIEKLKSLDHTVTIFCSPTGKHSKLANNNGFVCAVQGFIATHFHSKE